MAASIFLCKFHTLSNLATVVSIWVSYDLHVKWMRSKLVFTQLDSIQNTGMLRRMLMEMVFVLVQPYPFLEGKHPIYSNSIGRTYQETEDVFTIGINFSWNDWVLCFTVILRVYLIIKSILSISYYTDPRAQRVCKIYGC